MRKGTFGVGFYPPLESSIFSEPNYSRSRTSTSGKGDKEPAVCTRGTKWLQALLLAGSVAGCMQEIQDTTAVFLTKPAVWDMQCQEVQSH